MKYLISQFFNLRIFMIIGLLAVCLTVPLTQNSETPVDLPEFDGCTGIMVGCLATEDGSVITSHTIDGWYRTWVNISPYRKNEADATNGICFGRMYTVSPEDDSTVLVMGEIPEAPESYSFINTAYPP